MKKKYKYSTELEHKGSTLSKSKPGRKFLIELWETFGSKSKFVFHNKKYAFACKMFEYIYEPVFSEVNTLFYKIGFHRYLASVFYKNFINNNLTAERLFNNFYGFIKGGAETPLISFIEKSHIEKSSPLYFINKFCYEYKSEIGSDIDFGNNDNLYLLDLTFTSLSLLLGVFSDGSVEPMEVHCDDSKQIEYHKDYYSEMVNNENIVFEDLFTSHAQISYNLSEIPICENSKDVPQIQICDLLISSYTYASLRPDLDFSKRIFELSSNSFIKQFSILPDEIQMIFDKHEIDIFNQIIELLSSDVSKDDKINMLRSLSYNLKVYQNERNTFLLKLKIPPNKIC